MKFAKYLQEEVVPEWRKAYLDYKQCKKYLKAIEAALDKLEQDPAQQTQNRSNHGDIRPSASLPSDLEQSNRILNGPITLEPESEVYEPPAPAHVDSSSSPDESTGTTPIISQSHGILRNYDTIPVSSQSAPLTPLATPTLGKNQPDNDLPIGSGVNKKSRRSISLKNGLPGGGLQRRNSIAHQLGDVARDHSPQLLKDLTRRFTVANAGHANRSRHIQVEDNSLDSVMDQLLDEEKGFFKYLDSQLVMVNDFYRDKELEAETKLKVLKQQIFVAEEWKRQYDNKVAKARSHKAWYQNEWSKVRSGLGNLMVDTSATQDITLAPRVPPEPADAQSTGNSDQAKDLAAGTSTGARATPIQGLRQRDIRGSSERKHPLVDQTPYQAEVILDDEESRRQRLNHNVARSRIKTALYEFYRSLEMLKNYKVLNNTGFVKIMKKFDKTAGWKASKAFVASKLRPAYFMSSTILSDLMEETENVFIEKFESGYRRRGMAKLRIPDTKHQLHNATSARVGVYLGISLPLFILGLQAALQADTQERIPYWGNLLVIYGALLLPILFSCLFGINMYAWSKSRINYKFIFEFDPRDNLDYHQFFELPAFFILIFCLCLYLEFASSWTEHFAVGYFPVIAFFIILAIMLCPLPIARWDARRWFLQSIGRILVSGYYNIEFRDFFLADEMNSLAYSIEQFEYAICAYSHSWDSSVAQTCATGKSWVTPFVTALPSWFRFLQCLRRFRDTLEWFPHLVNAGKYFSTLVQLFVYFTYRRHYDTSTKIAYIVISTFTSTYTYSWDVYMDWGLFRFGKHGGGAYGHPFLRPELVYPRTWVYYVAIVFDFFGRFIWMTRLIPMNLNVSVLSFILALIEMLRRWMWNFFRLENEHLNNCGQFRAIKDIPLPFHIRVEGESDEEEIEEDQVSAAINNERQGTVKFSDGSQMGALAEGNKPDIKTKFGGATEDAANQLRFSSLTGSSHSVHATVSSPGGIRPAIKSRPSDASTPPYDQQHSNTLMVDAMTEAGFADDRREQLAAANKFYGRRDFDSKIADGPVEGLFRIRRKSSASLSQIGLGINVQAVNTSQDGLSESASRSRGNLKNAIFGRKHDTDEDYDSDTDEV